MAVNEEIFVGSGATLAFVPEVIISDYIDASESSTTTATMLDAHSANIELVPNLYKGCTIELFDASASISSIHTITSNSTTMFTFTPAQAFSGGFQADSDYFHVHAYGAPCPAKRVGSNSLKLNADNWLGLVETATFPTTEGVFPPAATAVVGPPKPPIKYLAVPKFPPAAHAAAVITFDDELYSSVNKYLEVPGPA